MHLYSITQSVIYRKHVFENINYVYCSPEAISSRKNLSLIDFLNPSWVVKMLFGCA